MQKYSLKNNGCIKGQTSCGQLGLETSVKPSGQTQTVGGCYLFNLYHSGMIKNVRVRWWLDYDDDSDDDDDEDDDDEDGRWWSTMEETVVGWILPLHSVHVKLCQQVRRVVKRIRERKIPKFSSCNFDILDAMLFIALLLI